MAHLTFTQRSIRVVLPNKSRVRHDGKPFSGKPSTFGGLLIAKRKEAGLTQLALAQATRIPRKWLGRWERNRAVPSEEGLAKLSQILELSNIQGQPTSSVPDTAWKFFDENPAFLPIPTPIPTAGIPPQS